MEERVNLDSVTFKFSQTENCCSDEQDGVETLTVKCESSLGITNDGGCFFVLKTEQWAIDGPEDLAALLEKIKQAIDIVK
jgi:hypothetical protein